MSPPRVEVGLDIDCHGRAHRRPGKLVLARPLHAHRAPAGGARQQHRIEGHVVGAVVAVAAGALDVLDDDVLLRQRQRQATGRRAGCRRPGSATRRARLSAPVHCAIAQEGAIEAWAMKGREYCRRMVRGDLRGRRRLPLVDGRGLDGLALEPGGEVGLVGQAVAGAPRRALAQGCEARLGRGLRLGDDADEAAVAHDGNDAGNRRARRPHPAR